MVLPSTARKGNTASNIRHNILLFRSGSWSQLLTKREAPNFKRPFDKAKRAIKLASVGNFSAANRALTSSGVWDVEEVRDKLLELHPKGNPLTRLR